MIEIVPITQHAPLGLTAGTSAFFWLLDRVVFSCFILISELHKEGIRKKEWQRYVGRKGGRRDFQIDLAIAVIDYGIQQDWKNKEAAKPSWMRQTQVKPCEFKKCFFCRNNETTGIYHDKSSIIMTSPQSGKKKKKNIKCTNVRVLLPSIYTSYCRQYYGILPETLSSSQKRRNCKNSRLGCALCQESICKQCWSEGYNNKYHNP